MLFSPIARLAFLLAALVPLVSCSRTQDVTMTVAPSTDADASPVHDMPVQEHALVGTSAPAIEAALLDDSRFNLQQAAAGHAVVMLDFWATWCGPCVMELPILMQLAEEYQSKGVALYAVNLQEDPETIRKFLEKKSWNLNVVLDPQGDFGAAYGVEGIPFLVLVGPDGKVRKVHQGYSDHVEQQLRQELDALVAATTPSS